MTRRRTFRIGTRGSPLALAQSEEARRAMAEAAHRPLDEFEIVPIRTTGDRILDRPLADAGGKGLFTKELDAALLEDRIDCAVHSAKDLPTFLPEGLEIAGYRPREDPRDALAARSASRLADLAPGSSFGSASPRRIAQALRRRPDLKPTLLRGNVETRLRKAEIGEIGATVLAAAGLKRLGLLERASALLPVDEFLPAAGQGAVAITMRRGDEEFRTLIESALDPATGAGLAAERAFLAALDGSCRTPLACHAELEGDALRLRGAAFARDGSQIWEISGFGSASDCEQIGRRAGERLRELLPIGFFDD